jgi:RNA ligase (TIGR02306 family)
LLPLSVLPTPGNEGDDVTDLLGILKWEPQLPSSLAGQIRGPFPAEIPKTEQERIQNLYPITYDGVFDITEKLDGTSCTMYLDGDAQFHVCSRNLDLKKDGRNVYWQMAIKLDIEGIMVALGLLNYALQGEIVGPGVQKNPYKLNELKFYVFDVYDVENGRYLSPPECDAFMQKNFGALVPQVPRLGITVIHLESIDDLLAFAEGKSKLADVPREGVVLRGISDDRFSFKVISNSYLLKEKDEIKIASVISESL